MLRERIDFQYLRPPRIRRLSLTSLIDVIFLLLLFFMLSSTFTRFSEVDIIEQGTGGAVNSAKPDVLLQLDGNGWKINGRATTQEQGLVQLQSLAQNGARSLLLLTNRRVTTQDLVRSIEIIRAQTPLAVTVSQ